MSAAPSVPVNAPDTLRPLFAMGWLVLVFLLLVPWAWTSSEKPQAKPSTLVDPSVLTAQALWADEQVLNAVWSDQARQWTASQSPSFHDDLPLSKAWSDLDASVLALQDRAGQVLQVQQLQKAQLLLEPYTRKGHPDIQRLANSLQAHVGSLINQAPADAAATTLVLTWGNLEQVVDDLNQIQLQLTEIRRWSISNSVAYDDKLPLRFHQQMALVFPTLYVQQLENHANLLFKSRLAIENAMAQAQLQALLNTAADPETTPQTNWWVLLVCLLVGAGWLLALGRAHAQTRAQTSVQTETMLAQHRAALQAVQSQLQEAMDKSLVAASPPPPAQAAMPEAWAQVQADVPDLLGRVKTIQHLFDAGRSQEWVARDLAILETKLRQWEKATQPGPDSPDGAHNA
jgi:hypothetical protein